MKRINLKHIAPYALCFALLFSGAAQADAQGGKKGAKKDKSEQKDSAKVVKTPYQKLFEKKKDVKSSKGILTLHNIEGKLYLEVPVTVMGESFLMSSVVENVSSLGLSYAGQRTSRPLHVVFSKTDSLVQIRAKGKPQLVNDNDTGIKLALKESSLPPIINSAPIAAWNPDSTAVLFDATSFFLSGNKYIGTLNASSFGGFIQKVSSFSKELSQLKDVKAYQNSVSIISDMTYTFKTYFLGMESGGSEYLTVELKTTLAQLPKDEFKPRVADYRIGTGVTSFDMFNSTKQGLEQDYFTTRWRMEPADKEAYFNGELSKPEKPIVFYVDTLFPVEWRAAVKRGILKWNSAFEKAGFKDAIEVYDYPSAKEDSLFDAANIAYNCVRYAQLASRTITRQVNSDPRTGEILSASILFFRDAPITLQRERLYQTAEVEPAVRSYELPTDLMCDALELATTREMGFCLGLTANYAASSWMPVDSLRSATFTAREGITSSVMDQIKYNYVARPGDIEKGVKLTADNLGVYDLYAIDWLYRAYPEGTEEASVLRKKIEDKASDRRYLYGKQQNWAAYFDPRSSAEDLGDDKIAATRQGVETLKYVSQNAESWVNKDNVDESYRELFVDFIFLKLYDYYRSIMVNIGGIEINQRYEGDPVPAYMPVSRKLQQESLAYMLEQADDLDWLDNPELLKMSGMNATLSTYFANNLMGLPLQRIAMVAFTQNKRPLENAEEIVGNADEMVGTSDQQYSNEYDGPYTVDDMVAQYMAFALKNIGKGEAPSKAQKAALFQLTNLLVNNSSLPYVQKAKAKNSRAFQLVDNNNPYSYHNLLARCYPNEFITDADQAASESNFGSIFGGSFGGNFGSIFGSNLGSNVGGKFDGNFDGNFGSNFGSNFGGNFGSNFDGNAEASNGNTIMATLNGNAAAFDGATSSYDVLTSIKYLTSQDMSPIFYKHMLSLRKELNRASRKAKEPETKSLVDYLIQTIDRANQ